MTASTIIDRKQLSTAQRIVVKVGSSLLASLSEGIDKSLIQRLSQELAALRHQGRDVVLVSSGAVACGCVELRFPSRPTSLPLIQAAAAVGQGVLIRLYREVFAAEGVLVGQVLLTRDDLHDRRRFLHARNTLRELLRLGVVPIVNENDTVAIEELKLKLGDNDALAVAVTQLIDADCLILLSDVPGLYDRPPSEEDAALICHVEEVNADLLRLGGGSGSAVGSGGMRTKLAAALASAISGRPLIVADGKREGILAAILAGEEVGTFFAPSEKRAGARAQWIAFGRVPEGSILVDEGARRALVEGKKSLLAIGVREVHGDFEEGDTVSIRTLANVEFARGLVNFSSQELRTIAGHRSEEFESLLGYTCAETVVHRDNLVVFGD